MGEPLGDASGETGADAEAEADGDGDTAGEAGDGEWRAAGDPGPQATAMAATTASTASLAGVPVKLALP